MTFQLDRLERCQAEARRLVEEGKAYEDEGAIRFRMPDEGVTGWDDVVRGRIEFPNDELDDLVIVRSRRPADLQLRLAGRGLARRDHARDPRRRPRLEHAEADPDPARRSAPTCRSTRTCRTSSATDGSKLSKRHGAVSVDEFREAGLPARRADELPRAARLGATTTRRRSCRREELIERFTLERVGAEPGDVRLPEARLDERRLPAGARAGRVRGRAPRVAARAGDRLGRGARARGGAARAGEDRAARRVPGLRGLPLRAGGARSGRARRSSSDPVRGGDRARGGRAVHGGGDRDGADASSASGWG